MRGDLARLCSLLDGGEAADGCNNVRRLAWAPARTL